MADGELNPSTVDIFLSSLSEVQSKRSGPLGRLLSAKNVRVLHRDPGASPPRIALSQRNGFTSYPTVLRLSGTGVVAASQWNKPELLSALDDQPVSICNAIPRVWNETAWSYYGATRTLTGKLSEKVIHTSQHTLQVSDQAWLDGVTCYVWTETVVGGSGPVTTTYAGFQADNGTWVATPTVLGTSGGLARPTAAKVVTDGTVFWIVFNDAATTPGLIVYVFDTHGAFLAGTATTLPTGSGYPGFWDITPAVTTGGYSMELAVPIAVGNGVDAGVVFHGYGWTGSAIIHTSNSDASLHTSGPVAWITNDTGDGLAYLSTCQGSNDSGANVWAYQVTNRAQTHVYGSGIAIASLFELDTIAGFTFTDGTGVGVVLSIGLLLTMVTPAAAGPPFDPALRTLSSTQITHGGTVTTGRTTQSVCQVSRAFEVDGEYYVVGYYQSGGGVTVTPKQQTVTVTPLSDFMIGAAVQDLSVQAGDFTEGSPVSVSSNSAQFVDVNVTNAASAQSISPPDFVNVTTFTGGAAIGIPDGTQVLIWKFGSRPAGAGDSGSRLVIAGSTGVAGSVGTWDVISTDSSGRYVTPLGKVGSLPGDVIPIGNFTGGTFALTSLTAYTVSDLSPFINGQTAQFFSTTAGAKVTVSGSAHGNNVTAAAVQRVLYGQPGPNYFSYGNGPLGFIWVLTGSQTTAVDTFSAVVSPGLTNGWSFAQGEFDFTYVGTSLTVSADPLLTSNVGTYTITSVTNQNEVVTGGQATLTAQVFAAPLPTISVVLAATQTAYTFNFATAPANYTFLGAFLSIQNADAVNDGVYQVVQINADGSFVATPTNGLTNQVNEAFGGSVVATLFFAQNLAQQYQPTWFLVPLTGSQPVTGRWESGLAYADWRIEGDSTIAANLYPMCLSTPVRNAVGWQLALPYRAQNVTQGVTEATTAGQVNIVNEVEDSTVGLKQFTLADASGLPYSNSGELLIPGPMATVFTPSGFLEDNINVGLEQPFLVSQSVASTGTLALTVGAKYQLVAVAEYTDENGSRIFSLPSPVLNFQMGGTNNVATYGGRLPFPLGTTGQPVANTFGVTCRLVSLSLYRTAFINGVPTTTRFKITDDLNVNGLAPISANNASGFSFPDSFTWNYIDSNPDNGLNANEPLYTDKGFLPRFPSPPFVFGVGNWKGREWAIGYDGAVWMSAENTEGDAPWFFTGFRIILPTDDAPVAMAVLENSLIVFCGEGAVFQLPATTFPDATGKNGSLPTPVQLPFNVDCTGFAVSLDAAVAFSSNNRGPSVWLITRDLKLTWLTEAIKDSLTEPIIGMSVDADQLLHVVTQNTWWVYDQIANVWTQYVLPTPVALVSQVAGNINFQDANRAWQADPDSFVDFDGTTSFSIPPDATLASINFSTVRGLKTVWEFQLIGTYKGPHRVNIVVTYPDEYNEPPTTFGPFTPDPSAPYVITFNPRIEEAASYGVRVFVDFVGVTDPGDSFEFELITAEVGVDRKVGVTKLPDSQTANSTG